MGAKLRRSIVLIHLALIAMWIPLAAQGKLTGFFDALKKVSADNVNARIHVLDEFPIDRMYALDTEADIIHNLGFKYDKENPADPESLPIY